MRNLACFLALVCVGFFLPRQSKATHIFGGEISYQAVAPGVFSATFVAYYWMSHGIPGSQTVQFALRSPGCNAGTTFNGTLQSNHGFNVNLTPNKKCGTAQDSIGRAIYTASFAIPNTQPQCSEWYLSVREPQKSRVANIPALTSDLYVEAYLNVFTAALGQNSPVFLWPNSLVFNVNEPATYSAMAKQDTLQQDSIVYALKPAMNEYNTPLTYAPNLSATQPLPTSSGVTLHPLTGQITFTPNVYDPAGNNAYTVVVEATTFKKVNGVVRKISAVQRNLPVFITNNPGNSNPEFMNVTANGQPVQANEVVEIQGGNTLRFQFHTADADASDTLRVISNPAEHNSMPAHTVSFLLGQTRPTVTYTFKTRPVSSDQLYFFTVSVFDNACPVRGITTQVYGFKVLANPLGQKETLALEENFTAYPNPFSEAVTFRTQAKGSNPKIIIYNLLGQQIDEVAIKTSGENAEDIPWQNAARFPGGTYVAKLISEGRTVQILKFIKR